MIWVYRVVALVFLGYGLLLVLGDLPPHEEPYSGISFTMGFFLMVLPCLGNLVNSVVGPRMFLVRWGLVFVNALNTAWWVLLLGYDPDLLFLLSTLSSVILLILSVALIRVWGRAAREADQYCG